MAAVETLVTDHLDLWTVAVKRKSTAGRGSSSKVELYGIKRLRELILELAVRGLLVPQDSQDEPASELLKRIAAEKAKLMKDGKIRKDKLLPSIGDADRLFDLPRGWVWARLGGIGTVASSSRVHQKDWQASGVPFFRTREIVLLSQHGFVDNELFISEDLYQSFAKNGFVPEAGDLMFTGVGTIGVPYVVADGDKFYFKDASVLIFKNHFRIYPRFLSCFMRSPCWINAIHEDSMGTTVHTLTIVRANNVPVPLPPLAEQHRIVAKVDELMALCDQLEQQTDASLGAHLTLVETFLSALTSAADHAQFASAWQRIAGHFDTLFTTEESIDQLKQTILQLAVMGKLVPQDSNDEPASELLKMIAAEKARLVNEGKINKERLLPPVGDAEAPYKLPQGWAWIRLGQCGVCSTGKTPRTNEPKYYDGDIPFIGPGQISIDGELSAPEKFVSEAGLEESSEAQPNDIFMVCIGGSIGKAAIADKQLAFNQQINAIRPIQIFSKYLYVAVSSKHFTDGVIANATGSATPIINRSKWEELPVPICSIQEQIRIVAKVDELMALCDQLKCRLSDAQTTQLHLADALVEQAIC